MAQLHAEMTIKIHPEMTEEGREMLRQMIREELFIIQQERQMVEMWESQQEEEHAWLKKRSIEERELIARSIFPEGDRNSGTSERTLDALWKIAKEVSKGETTYRDELRCKHCVFCNGEEDPQDALNYYHETSCITMIASVIFAPKKGMIREENKLLIVGSRKHEEDSVGTLKEDSNWSHLNLPIGGEANGD
jgi:hypothetical protein